MRIGAPLNNDPVPSLQWVEIATTLQLPSFHLVGLPSPEVSEARERVRAAVEASGFEFPRRRLTLNLSPASIRKRGTGLDLAIALAVLGAAHDSPGKLGAVVAWGELGLDGTVKSVGQVFRAVYACHRARVGALILPEAERAEAQEALRLIREAEGEASAQLPRIVPVYNLSEAWRAVTHGELELLATPPEPAPPTAIRSKLETPLLPLPEGLERLICISAAGGHHLLLLGPRGTGKSHALEWLCALQPSQTAQARVQHLLLSELTSESLSSTPVRRVSSQVKPGALLGGAGPESIRPGEVTLADGGLLIADEFPEWPRDSRESLREPLERGRVNLSRVHRSIELPASFTLAANGNLCPCGGWPPELPLPIPVEDCPVRRPPKCRCSFRERSHYLAKLSGPVLDRMDLVSLVLSPARPRKPIRAATQRLELLRTKVEALRDHLVKTWGAASSRIPSPELERLLERNPSWDPASAALNLRARHKIVRVAITLAGWDGVAEPSPAHFAEAAFYRPESHGLCLS